jgi:hypothetical protein
LLLLLLLLLLLFSPCIFRFWKILLRASGAHNRFSLSFFLFFVVLSPSFCCICLHVRGLLTLPENRMRLLRAYSIEGYLLACSSACFASSVADVDSFPRDNKYKIPEPPFNSHREDREYSVVLPCI